MKGQGNMKNSGEEVKSFRAISLSEYDFFYSCKHTYVFALRYMYCSQ